MKKGIHIIRALWHDPERALPDQEDIEEFALYAPPPKKRMTVLLYGFSEETKTIDDAAKFWGSMYEM